MLRSSAHFGLTTLLLTAWMFITRPATTSAVVLWSDSSTILAHETGMGNDILVGAVKRDDSAGDTLYFKFHVNPLSDQTTEEYFAAFELFEGDVERVGIGNAFKAWAYSVFFNAEHNSESNRTADYIDLRSTRPQRSAQGTPVTYQLPERDVGATIVFKIQYVPGEDDLITVWLNPDLGSGANEVYQAEGLTTRFNANASFDELRLRHGGGGKGWSFSEMAIATSFNDFVDVSSAKPSGVASPTRGALAINFRSWQKGQGLPQSPVHGLAQTRDGYMWIGTDDGIARFDGIRFVSFGPREGLNSGPVRAVLADGSGAVWIGTVSGGLSRWQSGQAKTFKTDDGLPSNSITALEEDRRGRLWIGTDAGLVLLENGKVIPLREGNSFKQKVVTALRKGKHNEMWCAVKGLGLLHFYKESFELVSDPSVAELLQDIRCVLEDQAGRTWVGTGDNVIVCRENDHWQRYRIPRHLARPAISSLAEEPDGTIWAGSPGGGLIQFKDGKFTSVPASTGLAGNLVESLFVDRDGELWVGTDSGLNLLRRKRLFALGQNEGLGFGAVHALAEVAPGVTWAVKPNDGLYRWDGRTFSRLTAAGFSPRESQINALLAGHDGACWVAGANGVLRYKDPIAAADEVMGFELPKFNITSLNEDRQGRLCAGTREGKVFWLDGGKWIAQTKLTLTNAITSLIPDSETTMWVGTDGAGLYRLENGAWDHIDRADGLLSDFIRTLYQDAEGVLWVGTAGGGLSRCRNGRISNFTARDGLPDNTILQILEDDAGRLWLGTSVGIACVSKRGLNDFTAGKNSTIFSQLYNKSEGMLSEECTGGFFPSGLKTSSGLFWFSTAKGAVVVDPRNQPTNAPVPSVTLEEILVDGIPDPKFVPAGMLAEGAKPQTLYIGPGKHQIELRYTGLSFDAPELLRFRYRLDGLENEWQEAGSRRTAFYNYVPPGDYHFRVIACNADGVWAKSSAELLLVVQHHFWQTWWFITLAGLSLVMSVAIVIRFVERRKLHQRLKRLEQERALEQERTRIAQDLHDEMGAKLCRISFLSEHARTGDLMATELKEQIATISNASREVLHSLDEIVWAVNPQNDTVEHVASYVGQYAQEYFQRTGIECEMDIPRELPPHPLSSQARHHLFLAVHEALTNILKHSGATRAKVVMTCVDSIFEIVVSDNGAGFARPTAQLNGEGVATGTGNGLNNMHDRLTAIGGQCRMESAQEGGTVIRFILPLDLKLK